MEKRCRLMATYGWTPEQLRRMPGGQSWAYYCWAVENNTTVKRTSKGYVKQEWEKLMQNRK